MAGSTAAADSDAKVNWLSHRRPSGTTPCVTYRHRSFTPTVTRRCTTSWRSRPPHQSRPPAQTDATAPHFQPASGPEQVVLVTAPCECGLVLRERTVQVSPGVSLFVASTTGRADSVLLVVHGGPDWDHSYLREPLSQLADRHRVVLPDLRGCGRSSQGLAEADYTPDAVVGDLLALADELGARRFSLLGFSWGGLIGQRVAVAVPDRVEHLIIASSGVLPVDAAAFGQCPEREERRAAEASVWADTSLAGPQLTRAAAVASAPANVWRAEALPGYLLRLADVQFSAEWLRPWQAGILPASPPRAPHCPARSDRCPHLVAARAPRHDVSGVWRPAGRRNAPVLPSSRARGSRAHGPRRPTQRLAGRNRPFSRIATSTPCRKPIVLR